MLRAPLCPLCHHYWCNWSLLAPFRVSSVRAADFRFCVTGINFKVSQPFSNCKLLPVFWWGNVSLSQSMVVPGHHRGIV